ncbi:hypothetical protein OG946_06935 [Streptomyces sp. NBC_01808]|uniref:hypothetical protein n=1 Tax=Streptomyces sp. NBC_01808 TaxID=2975947 RepID=UPI002DDC5FD5|nr:hypothetical protein [Streptomyces sp. NBC_01808]WSA37132.1 hypothetical protein OG946_06935 [Streptomyces sp. NBC_01808]
MVISSASCRDRDRPRPSGGPPGRSVSRTRPAALRSHVQRPRAGGRRGQQGLLHDVGDPDDAGEPPLAGEALAVHDEPDHGGAADGEDARPEAEVELPEVPPAQRGAEDQRPGAGDEDRPAGAVDRDEHRHHGEQGLHRVALRRRDVHGGGARQKTPATQ